MGWLRLVGPLKIIGLFCRIYSLLQGSFAKETCSSIVPANRSHPIVRHVVRHLVRHVVSHLMRHLARHSVRHVKGYVMGYVVRHVVSHMVRLVVRHLARHVVRHVVSHVVRQLARYLVRHVWAGYGQQDRLNYRSLWQNIVYLIGLFCKRVL